MAAPIIERVVVKVIATDTAFVDVRLPGVMLTGMIVTRAPGGTITLKAPTRTDRLGKVWPIYHLQPGVPEQVLEVVTRQWPRAGRPAGTGGR